jgi:hypothetical protein
VPTGGAWRWASDGEPIGIHGDLMWQGLLPAPLGGLKQTEQKLQRKYPVEFINGNPWTTVPIRAICGPDFPRGEPWVFYDERWLKALGVQMGSAAHILGEGRMCLFYPGHWKRGYAVADVLSQRVVNHVYSILKMANGVSATNAFIGRIHNDIWRPSA